MASNDQAGSFLLPTLETYQKSMRDSTVKAAGGGWNSVLQGGAFDLARTLGYRTPEERKIAQASAIYNDSVKRASSTSSDPLEQRRQVLIDLTQKFNSMGMSEYVAQILPELAQLEQRKQEMRKLTAEAGSAESKQTVDAATMGNDIAQDILGNVKTGADINESNARAADLESQTKLRGAEGQNYYNPKTGDQINVSQMDESVRAALRSAGYIEINTAITTDDPNKLRTKDRKEFNDAALATADLMNNLADIKEVVIKQPGAWTVGGKAASVVNSLAQQIQYSLKQQGISTADFNAASKDIDASGFFQRAGIQDARVQAMILNLAYVRAKALDPGGRLSNQDVEIAKQIVMGTNPTSQVALLEDIFRSAGRSFDTRAAIAQIADNDPARDQVRKASKRFIDVVPGGTNTGTGNPVVDKYLK
jgi:hypothetical protein